MKKGQLTLILIIGLLLIIIATFVFVRLNQGKTDVIQSSSTDQISFDLKKENFQDYFDQCSRDSIINANEEYGIRESNKNEYENYVSLKVKYCIDPLLADFKKIDYNINEGSVNTKVSFHEDTISVNVDYPISITKDDIGFDFETYKITFPRENFISIINMDDQEVLLPSTDKRAQIIVPAETSITKDGIPITSLSIKLIDKNFDGLENKVVVGNLIYEVSPSGAKFSKPIELSIKYRSKDYPPLVNEDSLSIAWWDSSAKVWKAQPTTIKDGRAIAYFKHLTKFAIVTGCGNQKIIATPILFKQEYNYNMEDLTKYDDSPEIYKIRIQQQSKIKNSFCSKQDTIWNIEEDGTVIPSPEEWKKVLDNEEEKIGLTIQQLSQEKFTFGDPTNPDEYCMENDVEVTPYCCCKLTGSNYRCSDKLMGKQECMTTMHEQGVDITSNGYKLIDPFSQNAKNYLVYDDYTCYNLTKTDSPLYDSSLKGGTRTLTTGKKILKKNIFGYNEESCVSGRTDDGDGDGIIYQIRFAPEGNSCYGGIEKVEYVAQGICDTTVSENPKGEQFSLDISYSAVTTDDFCAECSVNIKLIGDGIQLDENLYYSCENEGKLDILYEDNLAFCHECVNIEGLGLVSEKITGLDFCTLSEGCKPCLDFNNLNCVESLNDYYFCDEKTETGLRCTDENHAGLFKLEKISEKVYEDKCVACMIGIYPNPNACMYI